MKINVYYEDTGCGNLIYYANYRKYMERSRTEYMRECRVDFFSYQQKGYNFLQLLTHT